MNPNEKADEIWKEYEALIDFSPGNRQEADQIIKVRHKLLAEYLTLKGRHDLAAQVEAGK